MPWERVGEGGVKCHGRGYRVKCGEERQTAQLTSNATIYITQPLHGRT